MLHRNIIHLHRKVAVKAIRFTAKLCVPEVSTDLSNIAYA
ncbi:hypothetical protein C723_2367 [Christiangramia flava JLT2011]|uniref:Uncharacterized protein n=1 Tax=Christiangramia flava JLT2011 TaxID=1229726 RepID=A0A1L7I058_9FLAO|nr:hypothetical protein GRFL_0253 [Christiangramia flava JLT2011]OSS38649.1 hypothetical protein C723_2367 [Christiangramia flava JLT2011]